jgi:ABC-type multidrug transport system ATPase subunit
VALLELSGVRKSFWRASREVVVLDGVELRIDAGELLAVWGGRGVGKTTLARVAAGLQAPDAGTVRFGGRDLAKLSRGALSGLLLREIGWVRGGEPPDDEFEILDYVSVPLLGDRGPREARRAAVRALAAVGLRDYTGRRWAELTDGERTLAGIAHGLVREPRLLVVDDPTANLDVLECKALMGLLRSCAQRDGLGILVTVPSMPDVLQAHRIASLSEGRLLLPEEPPGGDGDVIEFPRRQRTA